MKTLTTILLLSITLFCKAQDQDICCYSQEKWDAREDYFQQREDSLQNIIASSTVNCDSLQALVDYYESDTVYFHVTGKKMVTFSDTLLNAFTVEIRQRSFNLNYYNDETDLYSIRSMYSNLGIYRFVGNSTFRNYIVIEPGDTAKIWTHNPLSWYLETAWDSKFVGNVEIDSTSFNVKTIQR